MRMLCDARQVTYLKSVAINLYNIDKATREYLYKPNTVYMNILMRALRASKQWHFNMRHLKSQTNINTTGVI